MPGWLSVGAILRGLRSAGPVWAGALVIVATLVYAAFIQVRSAGAASRVAVEHLETRVEKIDARVMEMKLTQVQVVTTMDALKELNRLILEELRALRSDFNAHRR